MTNNEEHRTDPVNTGIWTRVMRPTEYICVREKENTLLHGG